MCRRPMAGSVDPTRKRTQLELPTPDRTCRISLTRPVAVTMRAVFILVASVFSNRRKVVGCQGGGFVGTWSGPPLDRELRQGTIGPGFTGVHHSSPLRRKGLYVRRCAMSRWGGVVGGFLATTTEGHCNRARTGPAGRPPAPIARPVPRTDTTSKPVGRGADFDTAAGVVSVLSVSGGGREPPGRMPTHPTSEPRSL